MSRTAGETLAVDGNTGNLCSGTFELTVNWGDDSDSDIITARIIDLEGVCGSTSDWFRHNSQDVGTIFLSGIDINGSSTAEFGAVGGTASAPSVRFCYRATGAQEGTLAGTAAVSGEFVGNGHSEGPLGVLGTWPVLETAADGPDFTGCSEQT